MILTLTFLSLLIPLANQPADSTQTLRLNDIGYFETRGLNELVHENDGGVAR